MENLAYHKYNAEADKKVREELEIAGIPVYSFGLLDNEVKTYYIGILNGFTFVRSWYYWVAQGNMPLKYAKEIYNKYKDLDIRTYGIAGNDPPEKWAKNINYDKLIQPYSDKFFKKEITPEELRQKINEISAQGEQVVNLYHIDTQLGLNKFAEIIRENNIISEIIQDYH